MRYAAGKWVSVHDRLPETSGKYLACFACGYATTIDYSATYQAFNATDAFNKKFVLKCQLYPEYWAEIKLPKES